MNPRDHGFQYRVESAPVPSEADVVVVGAGIAGLSCALLLERQGVNVHVIEADDDVGGRIRTDELDGFRLDRGFQVLLTAYEEVQAQVDLPRLDLRSFKPGSLIWSGSKLERMVDPFRNPLEGLAALRARVGGLGDKRKVGKLRRELLRRSPAACLAGASRTTLEELEERGFSSAFIDAFFRPFFGGVFLDRELETAAALFRYYFRCFAAGNAAIPAGGMQRLPELFAAPLEDRITLSCPVSEVSPRGVVLSDGRTVRAEAVVVAVDGASAASLLGTPPPAYRAGVTAYFSAPEPPVRDPLLILDGTGAGPVNHVAVLSQVAPEYAPPGKHLISVSGVGPATRDPDAFRDTAPAQLHAWFGDSVKRWEHLRTYRIAHALPEQPPGSIGTGRRAPRTPEGIVVAGDHTTFGSIQGALLSGRRAAESLLGNEMKRTPPSWELLEPRVRPSST